MIYLADTDLTLALAACDLLDELHLALGVPNRDIRVLRELQLKLNSPRIRRKYPEDALATARRFLYRLGPWVDDDPAIEIDAEERRILANARGGSGGVSRVDTGEALLFLATRSLPDARILTGDHNSLRCLASDPSCAEIHRRLKGRVVCFEQALMLLTAHHTFAVVRSHVLPARACEERIHYLFPDEGVTEARVLKRLDDRIAGLQSETAGLLALLP